MYFDIHMWNSHLLVLMHVYIVKRKVVFLTCHRWRENQFLFLRTFMRNISSLFIFVGKALKYVFRGTDVGFCLSRVYTVF